MRVVPDGIIAELARMLNGKRFAALSGAGISTESGIPDYRGPGSEARKVKTVWYQDFTTDSGLRKRYWVRSAAGWPSMRGAIPNAAHSALAEMEHGGRISGVITQNVDGLHTAAGSAKVIELHGALRDVVCLSCGEKEPRTAFQDRLLPGNPDLKLVTAAPRPDGDSELPDEEFGGVEVPDCLRCGGILKPDVVFFGERVPAERVSRAVELVGSSDGLIVLGS